MIGNAKNFLADRCPFSDLAVLLLQSDFPDPIDQDIPTQRALNTTETKS